ncbi:LuxR C-terminal-related transcriptional regulator [Nesterenkonia sp. YGD6]|uniref:helix-turn-helix transcriptional regulator n=1 Tax=Nesterenkonia sp. YGD6 TaxID=2901231 RepID=UPI001F4D2CFE|nr:LuxR C-terminal-related transcriptional regulator [Nesterenkonia sp. YGD6]MCH8561887.1 LuxR C-terminal-related transcriptional regulator [Nesterenkonia sp. YGD6]
MTVISAPSGHGKTRAAAEWARHQPRPVAWLCLGPADDEPAALTSGVITALRGLLHADDDLREALGELDPGSDATTLYDQVCRTFEQPASVSVLVIDDAQRAAGQLRAGLLGMLVDDAPEHLRLVFLGTTPIEAWLAKQILEDSAAHLSAADLAFDRSETEGLLKRFGNSLDSREVLESTQGWPIAVQTAALASQRPPGAGDSLEDLLRSYVQTQILDGLGESLAVFILTTTACTELTAELATALSGRDDAAAVLDELVDRGIFLSRHCESGETPTYRWHPIFARQCTQILRRQDPTALNLLHLRAGEQLSSTNPLSALRHFQAAQDHDRAHQVLVANWLELIIGDHARQVATFCAGLPQRLSGAATTQLILACAEDVMGEHQVARTRFRKVLDSLPDDATDEGVESVLRVARLFLTDDPRAALTAARDVHARLSVSGEFEGRERVGVLFLLAWTELRLRLHPESAPEIMSAAAREWGAMGEAQLERSALGSLAMVDLWDGRNARARRILSEVDAPLQASTSISTHYEGSALGTAMGLLAYWSADFESATEWFGRVIEAGDAPVPLGGAVRTFLAFSAAGARDPALCRRAALELEAVSREEAQGVQWPIFRDAAQAVLEEVAGHRPRALALVERHPDAADLPMIGVVLAGILRRAGDPARAFRLLSRHRAFMGISYVAISARISAALVHRMRGEPDVAHEYCEYALDIAEREDIRQPFCDGDLNLRLLLTDHLTRRTSHEAFIASALTAEQSRRGVLAALSGREVEVYRLLQTSKTIQEIADALMVSVNTVKTHQRAIHRKLGVRTRREAQQLAP